jgi:hypothetical protein
MANPLRTAFLIVRFTDFVEAVQQGKPFGGSRGFWGRFLAINN